MLTLQSALIDSTLDGICLTDEEGNILIANRTLRQLVAEARRYPGTGRCQNGCSPLSDVITEPDRYRATDARAGARARSETSTDEFEVAGTGRVFTSYAAPVPRVAGGGSAWADLDAPGGPRRIARLDRMRDAFVATVSHELRTPLTSISGFLEMMLDEESALGAAGPASTST